MNQPSQFTLTFTIPELLLAVLCLVGIVALVYLIVVLAKLSKTLGALATVIDSNKKELDKTLKDLPEVTSHLNSTLTQVDGILKNSSPEIEETITGVKDTMINTARLTSDVSDTVEYVATSAIDTVDSLSSGLSSSAASFGYIKEIVEFLRAVLHK